MSNLEVDLLRKVRDQREQILTVNLPLTGGEAARFLPLYDSFTKETIKWNDQRHALVKEYAAQYRSMTAVLAANFIPRWIGVDEADSKLCLEWILRVEQMPGEKKAATSFQIDCRVGLMQEIQLASNLPLIQP